MNQQEIINTIALTRVKYYNVAGMMELYRRCEYGSSRVVRLRTIQDERKAL